jgi:hypothetical protein
MFRRAHELAHIIYWGSNIERWWVAETCMFVGSTFDFIAPSSMLKPGYYPKLEVRYPDAPGLGSKCDLYMGRLGDANDGARDGFWFEFKQIRGDRPDEVKSLAIDTLKFVHHKIPRGHAFLLVSATRQGETREACCRDGDRSAAKYLQVVMADVAERVAREASITLLADAFLEPAQFDPDWFEQEDDREENSWVSIALAAYEVAC